MNPHGARLLRPPGRRAARRGHRALAYPLPLGPAAGARSDLGGWRTRHAPAGSPTTPPSWPRARRPGASAGRPSTSPRCSRCRRLRDGRERARRATGRRRRASRSRTTSCMAHGAGVRRLRARAPRSARCINRQPQVRPERHRRGPRPPRGSTSHWNRGLPRPAAPRQLPARRSPSSDRWPYVRGGDLARICRPMDWFGINHYGPIVVRADPTARRFAGAARRRQDAPRNRHRLADLPAGASTSWSASRATTACPSTSPRTGPAAPTPRTRTGEVVDDPERVDYLRAYIEAMQRGDRGRGRRARLLRLVAARQLRVGGSGYANRFGLVHVDFATQTRTPKASARFYTEVIRSRGAALEGEDGG